MAIKPSSSRMVPLAQDSAAEGRWRLKDGLVAYLGLRRLMITYLFYLVLFTFPRQPTIGRQDEAPHAERRAATRWGADQASILYGLGGGVKPGFFFDTFFEFAYSCPQFSLNLNRNWIGDSNLSRHATCPRALWGAGA